MHLSYFVVKIKISFKNYSTVASKVNINSSYFRARSASACVIPVTRESDIPQLLKQGARRESQPGSISTANQSVLARLAGSVAAVAKQNATDGGEHSFHQSDCIHEETDDETESEEHGGSYYFNNTESRKNSCASSGHSPKVSSMSYVPGGNNNGCTNNGKSYERMITSNSNRAGTSNNGSITICGAIRDFFINTLRP